MDLEVTHSQGDAGDDSLRIQTTEGSNLGRAANTALNMAPRRGNPRAEREAASTKPKTISVITTRKYGEISENTGADSQHASPVVGS